MIHLQPEEEGLLCQGRWQDVFQEGFPSLRLIPKTAGEALFLILPSFAVLAAHTTLCCAVCSKVVTVMYSSPKMPLLKDFPPV